MAVVSEKVTVKVVWLSQVVGAMAAAGMVTQAVTVTVPEAGRWTLAVERLAVKGQVGSGVNLSDRVVGLL
jgi:hypothetical protein